MISNPKLQLEEFLQKILVSDESFMIAINLCRENCIEDIETLYDFSQEELEKIKFPLGIIKKI